MPRVHLGDFFSFSFSFLFLREKLGRTVSLPWILPPPPICSYISFDTLGSLCVSRQQRAAAVDPHRPTDWLMYLKLKRCGLLQRPNVHPAGSVTTNLFNQPFIFLWKNTHTGEERPTELYFFFFFPLKKRPNKKGKKHPPGPS